MRERESESERERERERENVLPIVKALLPFLCSHRSTRKQPLLQWAHFLPLLQLFTMVSAVLTTA